MTSLIQLVEAAADAGQDVVFEGGNEPERVPWRRLHDDAGAMAAALQARGIGDGSRVAILAATSRPMFTAVQACWLAGAAVIMLPLRTRLESDEEFRARTTERLALGEVQFTLCDPDLAAVADGSETVTVQDLVAAASSHHVYERPGDDPERTAVLQFTSGSTSDPKGVIIPERCLIDNCGAVLDRAPLAVGEDVMVSWLPLYHDMGLVYNAALAMTTGVEFVLSPPARFISSPAKWMEWMDTYGGTWTIGPNFAVTMGARLLARADSLDLSRCRRLGSGSEPVDPDAMDALARAGAPFGLDNGALYAGYGMAEATVAVSFVAPGTGFHADVVDAEALEHDGRAEPVAPGTGARRLARCGPPLRGMELRIVDPETGSPIPGRMVGEIELRGPSVVPGYFRRPDATAAAFRDDGWLRTGDQGYLAEGEVVVCGRLKDVIIVGGRNLFPEDLERPAQSVPGVRAGNVIAFGVTGGRKGDAVVVVAELKDGDPAQVRDGIARAVREAVGVRPDDVVLLAPGALPKTSSGKLRRSTCRARYQSKELDEL
ncbi:MAG: AMP-binding protein [Acidimicrobiales bacterium]